MSELSELYQEVILDHNRSPRNCGDMDDATHCADGHNPLCGDQITVYVKLTDGVIEDIRFEGNGCAISQASASMMTDRLKGVSRDEAETWFKKVHEMLTGSQTDPIDLVELGKLAALSGVCEYPIRVKCASLAWHTFAAALADEHDAVSTE